MHATIHRPWLGRIRLLDDAPIVTASDDLLRFGDLVELTAGSLRDARGPMVVHVDGSWGRGKTSFCRLLDARLVGETSGGGSGSGSSSGRKVSTAWYVASDDRSDTGDAVLAAVARALTDHDAEESARILRNWGSQASGDGVEGNDFESFRGWVGRELGWSMPSSTQGSIPLSAGPRRPGTPAQGEKAGAEPTWTLTLPQPQRRVAVVFIDDVDRCRPERVLEIFDAIRRFVTCPGLMFVVAADREVIQRAFEDTVEQLGATGTRRAEEAMEKYIRHRVELPTMSEISTHLTTQMRGLQMQLVEGGNLSLLRGPGLQLTDGVAVLLATSFRRGLSLRRLKRILNALAVELARAADGVGLTDDDLGDAAYEEREGAVWRPSTLPELAVPSIGSELPRQREDYPRYFLGRLVYDTARFMWPELVDGVDIDAQELDERVRGLVAVGRELARWPERTLEQVLAEIVPTGSHPASTPQWRRREFCRFLASLFESVAQASVQSVGTSAEPASHTDATDDDVDEDAPSPEPPRTGNLEGVARGSSKAQGTLTALEDEITKGNFATRRQGQRRTKSTQKHPAEVVELVPDYVEATELDSRSTTHQQSHELIQSLAGPTSRANATEDKGPRSDRELQSLHASLRSLLSKLANTKVVATELLSSVLNDTELLLWARLGHPGFEPSNLLTDVVALVDRTPWRILRNASGPLLDLSTTARLWRRWDEATALACALWSAQPNDLAIRVENTACLLEDLSRPGSLSPSSPPLPLKVREPTPDVKNPKVIVLCEDQPDHDRAAQGNELIRRGAADFDRLDPRNEAHLHFVVGVVGFIRAAREARLPPPEDVVSIASRMLAPYHDALREVPSPPTARPMLRLMASARDFDHETLARIDVIARQHSDLELNLALAEVLVELRDPKQSERVVQLYQSLEGSRLWTPAVLHNLATLHATRAGESPEAGRLWELAYRAGYRDSRLLRSFSQYLKRNDMTDEALLVIRRRDLPDDWHPFGEDHRLEDVHVPPEMLVS